LSPRAPRLFGATSRALDFDAAGRFAGAGCTGFDLAGFAGGGFDDFADFDDAAGFAGAVGFVAALGLAGAVGLAGAAGFMGAVSFEAAAGVGCVGPVT
jgi:hypothetical protein